LEGGASVENDTFVWREGRAEVSVAREGDFWNVLHTSTGRLLGPRLILYSERHKDAKHAAWDVMARVIRVSSDEDKGLIVARSAVKWMRMSEVAGDVDD
jgi:hypothetical protein